MSTSDNNTHAVGKIVITIRDVCTHYEAAVAKTVENSDPPSERDMEVMSSTQVIAMLCNDIVQLVVNNVLSLGLFLTITQNSHLIDADSHAVIELHGRDEMPAEWYEMMGKQQPDLDGLAPFEQFFSNMERDDGEETSE